MAGTRPATEDRALILASHVVSPMLTGDIDTTVITPPSAPAYQDGLFVTFSQFIAPDATPTFFWARIDTIYFRLFVTPITKYDFYTDGETIANQIDSTYWATPFWHGCADFAMGVQFLDVLGSPYYFNRLFSMYNMVQSIDVAGPHVAQRIVGFPAESDPATDGIDDVAGVPQVDWSKPELLFMHEGRLCVTDILFAGVAPFGTAGALRGMDDIGFWRIRDPEVAVPQYLQKTIEENQSGITVAQSINSNELFIVKAVGGGAVISGDLSFPTVRRLPGIHSTGNVYCKSINTPIGVCYAGVGGAYLWSGAESSQLLSEQLDGPFWNPYTGIFQDYTPEANRFGFQGQMGFMHPWILLPSFFMYDTRWQSWWLLDNPDDLMPSFAMHGTSQGHILAVYPEISAEQVIIASRFDPEQFATDWSWTSQPITPELYRVAEVREVNFQATATSAGSTMTITLAGLDNTTESHEVALIVDGRPHTYRVTFSIDTETFIVTFEADGNDDDAPALHTFRIGYQTLAQHPNQ